LIQKQTFNTKVKPYKPLKTSGLIKRNLRQQVTLLLIRFTGNRITISHFFERTSVLFHPGEGSMDKWYLVVYITSCASLQSTINQWQKSLEE